jgi:hypothetical protein
MLNVASPGHAENLREMSANAKPPLNREPRRTATRVCIIAHARALPQAECAIAAECGIIVDITDA